MRSKTTVPSCILEKPHVGVCVGKNSCIAQFSGSIGDLIGKLGINIGQICLVIFMVKLMTFCELQKDWKDLMFCIFYDALYL